MSFRPALLNKTAFQAVVASSRTITKNDNYKLKAYLNKYSLIRVMLGIFKDSFAEFQQDNKSFQQTVLNHVIATFSFCR